MPGRSCTLPDLFAAATDQRDLYMLPMGFSTHRVLASLNRIPRKLQ